MNISPLAHSQQLLPYPNTQCLHGPGRKHRVHFCVKFLLLDLVELTNSIHFSSQHEAFLNRLPIMMTPIGFKTFDAKV